MGRAMSPVPAAGLWSEKLPQILPDDEGYGSALPVFDLVDGPYTAEQLRNAAESLRALAAMCEARCAASLVNRARRMENGK